MFSNFSQWLTQVARIATLGFNHAKRTGHYHFRSSCRACCLKIRLTESIRLSLDHCERCGIPQLSTKDAFVCPSAGAETTPSGISFDHPRAALNPLLGEKNTAGVVKMGIVDRNQFTA